MQIFGSRFDWFHVPRTASLGIIIAFPALQNPTVLQIVLHWAKRFSCENRIWSTAPSIIPDGGAIYDFFTSETMLDGVRPISKYAPKRIHRILQEKEDQKWSNV